jgi:glycosyltransferase involved in cell wall biosynthesis
VKVLIVHNRYRSAQPSGENSVVDDEAALLAEHGCEVERLEVESDSIEDADFLQRLRLPARVVWSSAGTAMLRDAITGTEPEVVHFHNTFPLLSPAVLRIPRQAGVASVITLHNFRPLCAAATFLREKKVCEDCLGARFPWPAIRHGCYRESRMATLPLVAMNTLHSSLGTWTRFVDRIVFPSDFARRKYVEAGWPEDRFSVKHNTARPMGSVREGPGRGFVCVSRLGSEKGVDVLLDAWRLAFPEGGETLTIIGSGDERAMLESRAEGLAGVTFAGALPREDVMPVVARSRALVVPSRCYEVFPRTIVEAFSLGVPVIASRIGGLPEIVQDRRTGLTVPPESASDLAAALRELSGAVSLSVQLGEAAYSDYIQRFAPEPTTRALLEVYAQARASRGTALEPAAVSSLDHAAVQGALEASD